MNKKLQGFKKPYAALIFDVKCGQRQKSGVFFSKTREKHTRYQNHKNRSFARKNEEIKENRESYDSRFLV